jgi:hypothetical protein
LAADRSAGAGKISDWQTMRLDGDSLLQVAAEVPPIPSP